MQKKKRENISTFLSNSHSTVAMYNCYFPVLRECHFCFYYQNYSHWCQGDLLECHRHATWNSHQKYSLLKEQNQRHKSCIVHNSSVSCTIPLYCVFIILLNWIYGVGQVERSHAWTFFTVCFVEWVQKGSHHWYSWHSQYEVWQYFCDSMSACGNTRAVSNLNCSFCLREGCTVPPT